MRFVPVRSKKQEAELTLVRSQKEDKKRSVLPF
jgi:hypothetical protein